MRLFHVVVFICRAASSAAARALVNAGSSWPVLVAEAAPARSCESLSSFRSEGIVSILARVVIATADTPQHCRVTGVITPEVAFEVNLPDRWNRRFYMTGNGGLAGDALDLPTESRPHFGALTNGFVMARTNTGHDVRKEPGGSFILSNPQKALDYAYRAVHVTARKPRRGSPPSTTPNSIAFSSWSTPVRTAAVRVCWRRSAIPVSLTASLPMRRGSIRPASRSGRSGTRRRSLKRAIVDRQDQHGGREGDDEVRRD